MPTHAPWPGGIAVVDIASGPRPAVSIAGKPVLVVETSAGYRAIIGIPLDQSVDDPLRIEISQGDSRESKSIELRDTNYHVQRLTVDRKYVNPGEAALQRIGEERKLIDAALNNWRVQPLSDVVFRSPADGARSSSFGSRRIFNDQPRSPHKGMDISAAAGSPITVPLNAIVALTGDFYFNGNTVILDHGQGLISLYCHLKEIAVANGDVVQAGDILGTVGATGRVTGAHLHFATYLNGTAVDPALLLDVP